MDAILTAIKSVFDSLGATVMLPIIIFILAVILGAKPGKAFRAGLTIGIAFIGINLVINLMWGSLSGVAQAIVTNTGIQRDIVDVGWPSAAAIAFGSAVGLWVIPLALIVNIALLLANLTKTLNIDVWNYWHFAFIGSLVVALGQPLWVGLLAAAVAAAIALFLGDWTAKAVQRFYGLPGVSIPHLTSAPIVPIAVAINWLIERIPGVRDINADTDTIQKRLGVMGEPVVLGLLIGLVLSLIGYWPVLMTNFTKGITQVLQTSMNLAAVMFLLPRMVKILMEGLIPVSEAAREFMQKRASGREIYVGLDSAILIGHPAAISAAMVLVPIAILLSVILPGNRIILFADLAVIPFVIAMCAPVMRGNVFRMIVAGTVTLGLGFYTAMWLSPLFTETARAARFELPATAASATGIISIADGFIWLPFAFVGTVAALGLAGVLIVALVAAAAFFIYARNPRRWEAIAGGAEAPATSGD